MEMNRTTIRIFQNLETLSQSAADAFIQLAQSAIDEKNVFTVALTGGNTVTRFYELLAISPRVDQVDWDRIRFYWGDERLVPSEHVASNYALVNHILLNQVHMPQGNIYRMRGELELHEAIEDYQKKLQEQADEGLNWPKFDLVLLGMGSDGHIASIFPGEISENERTSSVIATTAEYQGRPGQRVSLTPLVFNSAKNIFFLVAGESKSRVLAQVFGDDGDPEELPVLRIQPKNGNVTWFVDQAAGGKLPKKFLQQEIN